MTRRQIYQIFDRDDMSTPVKETRNLNNARQYVSTSNEELAVVTRREETGKIEHIDRDNVEFITRTGK